jgi:Flp pilus assembly protein CpaB
VGPVVLISIGLVTLGVIVMAMGHRQVVHTTPLIEVLPDRNADVNMIQNEINTANVLVAHREMSASQTPPS